MITFTQAAKLRHRSENTTEMECVDNCGETPLESMGNVETGDYFLTLWIVYIWQLIDIAIETGSEVNQLTFVYWRERSNFYCVSLCVSFTLQILNWAQVFLSAIVEMPQYDDSFFIDSERGGKSRTYKINSSLVDRHRNYRYVKDKLKRRKNGASMKYVTNTGDTLNQMNSVVPKKCIYRMVDNSDSREFIWCYILSFVQFILFFHLLIWLNGF